MSTRTKFNNALLYALALCSNLIFYAPVSLLIRTRFGITFAQFFILQAIISISIFIFEVPSGYLCDRLGHKRTIILASLFSFIAKVFLIMSNNFWLFAIEALLEGVSAALLSGTISAYIYNISPESSAQISANYSTYSNIGFIISTLGFSIVNILWGINGLLIISTIFSAIALIICFYLKDSLLEKPPKAERVVHTPSSFKFKYTDFFIILITSIVSLGFILINFFYVTLIINIGISENYMSVLIILYTSLQLLTPFIVKKFGEKNPVHIIQLLFIVTIPIIIIIATMNNIWIIIPMLIFPTILSLIDIYIEKFQNIYIDRRGWEDQRATVFSKYSMISNLFEIIFLFFSSQISKLGVNMLFGAFGVFSCFVFIIITVNNRMNHKC